MQPDKVVSLVSTLCNNDMLFLWMALNVRVPDGYIVNGSDQQCVTTHPARLDGHLIRNYFSFCLEEIRGITRDSQKT